MLNVSNIIMNFLKKTKNTCKKGLLQGEVLSPVLFSMYVNYCELQLLPGNCPYVKIQMLNIFY